MLNNWIYLFLLCQLQWLFKGIHSNTNYCPNESELVVQMCQDNRVTEKSVVYVNSGGAPRLQIVVDCTCVIQATNSEIVWILELIDDTQLKADMGFTVNGADLLNKLTAGGKVNLTYSNRNDSSDGGGCVKISSAESTDSMFNVTCHKEKKITNTEGTASLFNDPDPESGNDATIIAIGVVGAVIVIAIVVVVAVFIIWRRRRNINGPDNSEPPGSTTKTKHYEDTTDNYGMQPNPAYEQYEGDKQNKTGTEHVYEEHYAIPDDPLHTDGHKTTEYDYAPLPNSNNTSTQLKQSVHDNTYDHTTTTSAGSKGVTENEYNHLPPSVTQKAEVDNYNSSNDIKVEPRATQSD